MPRRSSRIPAARRGPRALGAALACACLAATAAGPAVADDARGWEAGLQIGVVRPDPELDGRDNPDPQGALGFRFGWQGTKRLGLHADLLHWDVKTRTFAGDASVLNLRGALDLLLQPRRATRWYLTGGGGFESIRFDAADDYESAFVSAGLGQRIRVKRAWRYRWELRADRSLARDGLRGEDVLSVYALFGLQAGPTRYGQDTDGDGVRDVSDRCEDSPAGEPVGPDGCPRDRDGDGVPDRDDLCPDSPRGVAVEAGGCRPGEDLDGVDFDVDACPGTPRGAKVDDAGCPLDGDRDGVPDGLDRCPQTLHGIEVDETGCFLDRDRDGVYDGLGMDRCPDTPEGTEVDEFGCPLRKDPA